MKQIVGGTLTQDGVSLRTNFVSDRGAAWYADLYRRDGLSGGHVIKLGPGNDHVAREALAAWPGGLQVGGGMTPENAEEWISSGASHVIVTSCLFDAEGTLRMDRLKDLVSAVGAERLVLDLSCRRVQGGWAVAMNRWQTLTELRVTAETLDVLAEYCAEFLIHAADVEGLCTGIDRELVEMLGNWRRLNQMQSDILHGSELHRHHPGGGRHPGACGWRAGSQCGIRRRDRQLRFSAEMEEEKRVNPLGG